MTTGGLQLYMFHFQCALCGASPERVPLSEYLGGWKSAPPERLFSLLAAVSGALREVCGGHSRWHTKKFKEAVERLQTALECLDSGAPLTPDSLLHEQTPASLHFERQCPACLTEPGPRKRGQYFTAWPSACKVQVGNLLYETGLMLWPVLVVLPSWASGSFLKQLNVVRSEMRRSGKSMSMLECPQCGRFTTCLYGSPHPKQTGFCRWCVDMGGGFNLRIDVECSDNGSSVIRVVEADYRAPAKNAADIIPPEIRQQWTLPPHLESMK